MKNLIDYSKVILCVAILAFNPGCNDFLEPEPKSFLSPTNFYEDRAQSEAALNAVYDVLTLPGLYRGYNDYISFGDLAANGFSGGDDLYDQHNVEAGEPVLTNIWVSSYDGINRANSVITFVPAANMLDEDKNVILGEARFLRALFYFNLVQIFGPLPLHTTVVNSLDQTSLPRSSVADVYEVIIDDLRIAGDALPIQPAVSGRASKAAAKTLLARVYMARQEFQPARDLLREVIDFGIYDLWENYEDVFLVANENGKESIFEVQFLSNTGSEGNVKSVVLPTQLGDYVVNGPTFRDYAVEDALADLYIAGDHRRAINAVDSMFIDGDTIVFAETACLKYLDGSFTTNILDADNNFIVMRYAEVLLSYAEAENEVSGPSMEALDAVNQVRRRAFGQPIESPSEFDLATSLSQSELREKIWEERFMEFPLEGLQWFDLKRTDRLQSVENIQAFQLIYPIPQREMDVNFLVEQNPGYN